MDKSTKKEQYKRVGIFFAGLGLAYCLMMYFKGEGDTKQVGGREYKKEIRTGVDELTDQEMWVESSENKLEDMQTKSDLLESKNAQLEKKVDTLQNMIIHMGRQRGFIGQEEDKVDITKKDEEEATPLADKMEGFLEQKFREQKVEDFTSQRGVVEEESKERREPAKNKLSKSGIKVIKFSNPDNEYDLDENFIFAGTYARGVLVGSVTVSAGISSSSNPKPVMLRLTDMGNLPNKVKGFLKDAVIIGAAYGNLSSESVVIRLERIIKIDKKSRIGIDIPVKGYVAGENGDSDIRGMVFDRAGAVARTAAMAGFLSGVSEYITTSGSSAVKFEPNSGLAQFSPEKGAKMLEQGASKGIGNAVEKYADFMIKRAEQMQPVIKIDGGRKLTIVFTESVKASSVNMKKARKKLVR